MRTILKALAVSGVALLGVAPASAQPSTESVATGTPKPVKTIKVKPVDGPMPGARDSSPLPATDKPVHILRVRPSTMTGHGSGPADQR